MLLSTVIGKALFYIVAANVSMPFYLIVKVQKSSNLRESINVFNVNIYLSLTYII